MEAIGNSGGHPAGASKAPTRSDLPSHDQREHRPSLYLLLLFLVLAAGIITAGYLFYRGYARHFRGEVERGLSSIAELKVGQLVQWRKERLADASVFYRNKAFSGLVERLLETPADMDVRGRILSWLDRVQDAHQYDRVFILDAQGIERLAVPGTPVPVASHLLQQIPEILRSNKIVFLDFHRNTPDRPIHLSLVVPVGEESDGGRPLGVLVLRIDPAVYLYPFIQQWPSPSRTAETLLVRREGDEVLFLNELRFQKNAALSLRIPLRHLDLPAVMAALGQKGIVEGVDYHGVPVLADVRGIPDSPWFLVARMDSAEAFKPMRERRWLIIGLVAVLLFGAGAGAGLIWRQQRIRFFRERLAAAKRAYAVFSRQEALLSAVPDIIMEVDQNKIYIWANPAGTEFFGEDAIGKEAAFYFEGEQETYQIVKPLFNGHDDVIYVESWQRRKDGEKRLLAWRCRVLKDDSGRVTGAISSAHDITERKRAEVELWESERKFRETIKYLDEGYYSVTPDGLLLDHNQAYNLNLGFDIGQDLRGLKTPDFWQNPDDRKTYLNELMTKGFIRNYLVNVKKINGEKIVVMLNSHLEKDKEGRPVRIEGTFTDYTERKRVEEELRASLREKEVLLREIHHRVKNNMQIISSLFNLQAGHTTNEECRGILKEGQTRIRSMALVHEKLYQSCDLSKIDFAGYIQSLAVHLLHVYLVKPAQVRMETDFEDVSLDINSAVPCGLILNELISNALKHAFPGGRTGEIKIGLRRGPGGAVELRVADDGVGFPKGLDFRKAESFGLQIVNLLVDQLEAAIDLDRTKGTAFTMTFRELKYAPRA